MDLFLVTGIGFVLVTVVYFALLGTAVFRAVELTGWESKRVRKVKMRTLLFFILWVAFVSLWSASGVMGNFDNFPFNFLPIIVIPLAASIGITFFSPSFKEVVQHVSNQTLAALQSFRIPVEVLLWMLFIQGLLPEQMTFEGRNFDIVAGITGLVVAVWIARNGISRRILVAWNLIGLALLTNIVTIAILSTPSPVRIFWEEPANTIVTVFPVSLLPGLLVPLAYTMHFFSLRKLALETGTAGVIGSKA